MAMTVVDAKVYVARVMGGSATPGIIDAAGEAILRGYQDWQSSKFWRFLMKDTTRGFAVTGCTATATSAVVTAPSTGAFDGVNVGVTVTISSGTATLTAGTTVSSFTRNTDGTVATITLSNAFGGTTNVNATLTFSGNIPIIAGTNEYNLPPDFGSAYVAMLIGDQKRTLIYRDQRYWDRVIYDQTLQGIPSEYNTFNPDSDLSQGYKTAARLRFDRVPQTANTLRVRYYRGFNTTGTYIDIPDDFLYKFLDYCSAKLLERYKAQDDPAGFAASTMDSFEQAQECDDEVTDDNDMDSCLKSPYEMGQMRPLWGNGDFDPYR